MKAKDNKNVRNKSTNVPSSSNYNATVKALAPGSNTTIMNKSGNGLRKP